MNIILSGATGLIGSHLVEYLLEQQHNVSIITTNKSKAKTIFDTSVTVYEWSALNSLNPNTFDAVINLSGENIAQQRWTPKRKTEILNSRTHTTEKWINWLLKAKNKIPHLYNASAIGIYGLENRLSSNVIHTEVDDVLNSIPHDYLSAVARNWEKAAQVGVAHGIPITWLRFGVVLSQHGGMLKKLLPSFKLGLGAILGDGQQKISWVSLSDVIGSILFLLNTPEIVGPINVVAPEIITQQQFATTLAKELHRPLFFKLPVWLIKKIFAEMGEELLLGGQQVYPQRLKELGYVFQFPQLQQALYAEITKKL